jgi:hypothetical protein
MHFRIENRVYNVNIVTQIWCTDIIGKVTVYDGFPVVRVCFKFGNQPDMPNVEVITSEITGYGQFLWDWANNACDLFEFIEPELMDVNEWRRQKEKEIDEYIAKNEK